MLSGTQRAVNGKQSDTDERARIVSNPEETVTHSNVQTTVGPTQEYLGGFPRMKTKAESEKKARIVFNRQRQLQERKPVTHSNAQTTVGPTHEYLGGFPGGAVLVQRYWPGVPDDPGLHLTKHWEPGLATPQACGLDWWCKRACGSGYSCAKGRG